VARNQGIAVVLNLFFGAIINAAYGIATQVSGSVAFVSSSIINAINPQLVKAEGAKNRSLMMRMAEYESKYAFLLLSMVSVPLIFEMETILRWWLGEVPEHAVAFCQITLIAALCDQLSIGLTSAIQAIGNLKTYTLVFYTTKLLTLVAIWACIKLHLSASEALVSYAVVEFVGSLLRLPLLKNIAGLNIATFCKNVFGRIFVPFLVICGTCYATQHFLTSGYRFFVALVGSVLLGGIAAWLTCLDKNEQQFIYSYIYRHD
jgi:O-antigen/teichoic acid export membrane protein